MKDISEQQPTSGNGFIYILSNSSMPNIFKIGLTTNEVRERISALSGNTAVPTKFNVEKLYEIPVESLRIVEAAAHEILSLKGYHHGKEFFKCELTVCTAAVEDAILKAAQIIIS